MRSTGNRIFVWMPLLIGAAVAFGLLIGSFTGGKSGTIALRNSDKLRDILNYIEAEYVDTLKQEQLEEDAIVSLLQQLDPHSSYIPASELKHVSEPLEGNFDGIGIEFNIQRDTIMVVAAISGGPSESLGIRSGDRIVSIEGKNVAGNGIRNEQVMKQLRGKSGTKVKVGIFRPSIRKIREYSITRGKIPIYSLDAHHIIGGDIGYIRISRFSATTFEEYQKAFAELKQQGMKKLVLDLRDNPGGYLNAAVSLTDEFLSQGKKIVYTQGKARKREDFDATAKGDFETGGLAILIDEGSASASEIVSGAVQDNDRGWIVGRRSFGKGLVQEEVQFDDGSAMRLTIARYYTPTGRCIQRPYQKGKEAYYHELAERMQAGALLKPDTITKDSIVYRTPAGRIVYGGGGIMPDLFVPADTSGYSTYISEIAAAGHFSTFAFGYADANRKQLLAQYPNADAFTLKFNPSAMSTEFYRFLKNQGVIDDPAARSFSGSFIADQLRALLARNLYGYNGYYRVMNSRDKTVLKAIEILNSGKLVSRVQPGKLP
jgi:carboxyl-terminal processing protease